MAEVNEGLDIVLAQLLEIGVSLGDAVRIALWKRGVRLGDTTHKHSRSAIPEFAIRHRLNRNNLTASLYSGRTPTDEMVSALITELGGTSTWWREQMWQLARPTAAAS